MVHSWVNWIISGKEQIRRLALLLRTTYWFFLTCFCIFYSIYWFIRRLLRDLLPVRKELNSSKLCGYVNTPTSSLVWSAACCAGFILVVESYVTHGSSLSCHSFFSYFNCARPIQYTCTIYRFFQVNLAHFQVGTALAWAAVGAFGRWKTRKENLGSEGGFDPAGMRWSGKRIQKTHTSWCEMIYSFTEASVLPLRRFACTVISKQMSTNKYGSRFWMLMWKKRFICNTAKTWVVLGWILISTICKLFFFFFWFLAWTSWKTFKSPSLPELPGI